MAVARAAFLVGCFAAPGPGMADEFRQCVTKEPLPRIEEAAQTAVRQLVGARRIAGRSPSTWALTVPQALDRDSIPAAELFYESILTALVGSGKARVLERRLLNSLLAEAKATSSALFSYQDSARLGRLIGAEYVLVGSVFGTHQDTLRFNVRVVATSTGEVVSASAVDSFDPARPGQQHSCASVTLKHNRQSRWPGSVASQSYRIYIDKKILAELAPGTQTTVSLPAGIPLRYSIRGDRTETSTALLPELGVGSYSASLDFSEVKGKTQFSGLLLAPVIPIIAHATTGDNEHIQAQAALGVMKWLGLIVALSVLHGTDEQGEPFVVGDDARRRGVVGTWFAAGLVHLVQMGFAMEAAVRTWEPHRYVPQLHVRRLE